VTKKCWSDSCPPAAVGVHPPEDRQTVLTKDECGAIDAPQVRLLIIHEVRGHLYFHKTSCPVLPVRLSSALPS
jgi:hypothetical protein